MFSSHIVVSVFLYLAVLELLLHSLGIYLCLTTESLRQGDHQTDMMHSITRTSLEKRKVRHGILQLFYDVRAHPAMPSPLNSLHASMTTMRMESNPNFNMPPPPIPVTTTTFVEWQSLNRI